MQSLTWDLMQRNQGGRSCLLGKRFGEATCWRIRSSWTGDHVRPCVVCSLHGWRVRTRMHAGNPMALPLVRACFVGAATHVLALCSDALSLSHAACADNHDPAQCAFSALVHWQWPGYGDSSGESGGVGGASATAGTSPEHDALPHPMADGNALFDTAFQVLKQRHKKGVLSAAGSKEPGMHRGSCAAVVKLQEARKHRNDPSDDA